jgi:putative membrane protein
LPQLGAFVSSTGTPLARKGAALAPTGDDGDEAALAPRAKPSTDPGVDCCKRQAEIAAERTPMVARVLLQAPSGTRRMLDLQPQRAPDVLHPALRGIGDAHASRWRCKTVRAPHACLLVFALVWTALAIAPWDRGAWLLENLLTAVAVPLAVVTFPRFRFSDRTYVQATAFLLLHTVGSHYTYSRTPLGDIARATLGLSRNHFDRAVHFAFGALVLSACSELFFRPPARLPLGRQLGLSVALIAAFSGCYEVLEWLTAIVADPAAGTAFLGTQGDVWDAQKDFVCAVTGALLGVVVELRCLARPVRSAARR